MAKTQIADNINSWIRMQSNRNRHLLQDETTLLKNNFSVFYKTKQSYYQVIMLLCIYITDLKIYVHTKIHIQILIVVLFMIIKTKSN